SRGRRTSGPLRRLLGRVMALGAAHQKRALGVDEAYGEPVGPQWAYEAPLDERQRFAGSTWTLWSRPKSSRMCQACCCEKSAKKPPNFGGSRGDWLSRNTPVERTSARNGPELRAAGALSRPTI